jgi:gluconokinase
MATALVLMGVSGSGKTSVGRALSQELGWPFYDGDDYHPPENVRKMSLGIPLQDEDRYPWLERLHDLIGEHLQAGENLILACSALKEKYRQQLLRENEGVMFVYLKGDFDLLWRRMEGRKGHFMKPDMLRSQLDTLEVPLDALTVNIDQSVSGTVREIIAFMRRQHI